ncbi:MAG: ATP-binding cassette domain-containing protein, partial [Betaproteobacteria bacterium]|nr:ATP-binding cassette domain-containing protein [Betaproteobacteria bacterium]
MCEVAKSEGAEVHLHPINLSPQANAITVLLGATLAGKTSLMRLMAGLDVPTSGRVLVDDVDVTGIPVRKRNVAMVYQQFINYPSLTVYDSLGNKYDVRVNMWKSGTSEWTWAVDPTSLTAAKVPADSITGTGILSFGPDGLLTAPSPGTINFAPPGAKPVIITVDPGSGVNGLTDIASPTTAVLR